MAFTYITLDMDYTVAAVCAQLGLKADTLRKWERRYGVVEPRRSRGGYRLYSADDLARLRAFMAERGKGRPGEPSARTARQERARPRISEPAAVERALEAAESLDRARVAACFDETVDRLGFSRALERVWVPALTRLGEIAVGRGGLWIAREHCAVAVLRERMLERFKPPRGRAKLALCAPEGELHELGLICARAALAERGLPALYLGANLPAAAACAAARAAGVSRLCVSLTRRLTRGELGALARALRAPGLTVYFAGRAVPPLAGAVARAKAVFLGSDLEAALDRLEADLAN